MISASRPRSIRPSVVLGMISTRARVRRARCSRLIALLAYSDRAIRMRSSGWSRTALKNVVQARVALSVKAMQRASQPSSRPKDTLRSCRSAERSSAAR